MPHMDMDGSGGREYADHEVQIVTNQLDANGTNDTAEGTTVLDQLNPVSNRGIDSDELAELVAFRRVHYHDIDQEVLTNQTQNGSSFAESALGINLSQDEIPSQANAQNATSEERRVVEETEGFTNNVRGANYDEPGVIDFVASSVTSGFYELIETADSSGPQGAAGSGGVTKETFLNFREMFGSGPYVDRTDDLTIFAELQAQNLNASPAVETTYALYWAVEEMPEGRASFARP